MSVLLNARGEVIPDVYTLLADDAALPPGAVIVSLARWRAEADALTAHLHPVAVQLPNTVDVLTLSSDVLVRPMLVLDFPTFSDGRAYSQAGRLRDRAGYKGLIRATGAAVTVDQLVMMAQCGIEEFCLRADQDRDRCAALLRRSCSARPLHFRRETFS